ncbi:NAD/NADP transhydrogenase beta subunit (plasmid) [Nostoc flagelliforme CCNUN1]|uniref:NAD/NADP transhydrogenase beta subunit n=1 Tax=Nostoc flagelliforme CCNUN1 TaxID=2038116 RepID=A0A2K8T6S9_9NOSO|nr:hypothetical protein [Nostoc flagelliforme]AUB43406.1 NAD/NADP transhydrogenase beta subunit [Nostoc flagelliforme CCNUN1]
MYLLAQQVLGGELVKKASETNVFISAGFNDLWDRTLNGQLYETICKVGVLFAVATLTFFMIEWTKQMLNGDEQRAFTDFIWPLIVVVLLSNHGEVLGNSTLGIRNYINNVNNMVLVQTASGLDLRVAFQKAAGLSAARSAIGLAIERCRSSSLQPNEAIACLQQAKEDLSQKYPSAFDQNTGPFKWFSSAIDKVIEAPIEAIREKKNPIQILFSSISGFIGSGVTSTISLVMLSMNGSYQWAIELTMLVTAFLGPLAVGGSLLPYGAKSIYTWLVGYFSIGIGKLSFNMIVGFAGQLISDSQADQPMFFLFTIGICAPFLATGLAAGGGLALLQQINKASETYSVIAAEAGKAIITRGVSLAKFIK